MTDTAHQKAGLYLIWEESEATSGTPIQNIKDVEQTFMANPLKINLNHTKTVILLLNQYQSHRMAIKQANSKFWEAVDPIQAPHMGNKHPKQINPNYRLIKITARIKLAG